MEFTLKLLQVWQTHLSENERNLLMQFLPTGSDKEQVLQALLAGNNFHFGNPFLKWQVYIYLLFYTFPPVENGSFLLCSFCWPCIICVTHTFTHKSTHVLCDFTSDLFTKKLQLFGYFYFISLVLFSGDIVFEESNVEFESARFDWNLFLQGYITLFRSSSS